MALYNKPEFRWRVSAGMPVVMHCSGHFEKLSERDVKRLQAALKRRGVECRRRYKSLAIGECKFGVLLQALSAVRMSWPDFKGWVKVIYFDGERYIEEQSPEPAERGS